MSRSHRLREQIDACRGMSDLALPELAELAEACARDHGISRELALSQQFDRAVEGALNELPVPEGLEVRLVTALGAAATASAGGEILPAAAARGRGQWRRLLSLRRTWYAGAAAAALLLMAAGGGYYWHQAEQRIEQEQIASALGGWQKAAADTSRAGGGWPSDFVLPQLDVKPVRYVPFKTAEGWTAVAVDCTTETGKSATLFIVRSQSRFSFGPSPVTHLAHSGKKVATWRKGRLVYVLVEEVSKPRAGAAIYYGTSPPA